MLDKEINGKNFRLIEDDEFYIIIECQFIGLNDNGYSLFSDWKDVVKFKEFKEAKRYFEKLK